MKLGIIGLGYWGKILLNNLQKDDRQIITCDTYDAGRRHYVLPRS